MNPSTPLKPLLCLISGVLLLSSVTPAIKYVFQHCAVAPLTLASSRVGIAFVFLFLMTLLWDRAGLMSLTRGCVMRLGFLGILGVGSYAVAAWGLLYTSVTHYVLIYSLLPSCTTAFSIVMGKDRLNGLKLAGILLAFFGCLVAVCNDGVGQPLMRVEFGDILVLLFTLMMAGHLALSAGVVKRFGAMTANSVMFGSSTLVLLPGTLLGSSLSSGSASFMTIAAVFYIGLATAGVFLLRYVSLQTLTPATVSIYHNLIPVCTMVIAYFVLAEPIGRYTIAGAAIILAGAEVVRRGSTLLAVVLTAPPAISIVR